MADAPTTPTPPDADAAVDEAAAIARVEQIAADAEAPSNTDDKRKKQGPAGCLSRVTLMVNLMTLATLALFSVTMRPRVRQSFEDAEIELPALTEQVLGVASWKLLLAFAVIAGLMLAKEAMVKNKWIAFLLNLLVVPIAGAFVALYVVAVFMAVTRAGVPDI